MAGWRNGSRTWRFWSSHSSGTRAGTCATSSPRRSLDWAKMSRSGGSPGSSSENKTTARTPNYERILFKLSGEALSGDGRAGLDAAVLRLVAQEVKDVTAHGVQVAIVMGGGNLVRGADMSARLGIDEVTAHHMGMLATVINALALQDIMEKEGLVTRVQTAIEMHQIAEPFIRRRAIRHLEKGRTVIFAGGTGSPYFTTDPAAALRAIEIEADALDRKSTRLNSSHRTISYAVFCLK